MLAHHVVGSRQHMPQWWAAQNELSTGAIGHQERQVRATAGNQRIRERRNSASDVTNQPITDPIDLDALHVW